ncbi:MAG: hypothetical protein AMXMBFR7_37700 [Planctomycetota bacterium]
MAASLPELLTDFSSVGNASKEEIDRVQEGLGRGLPSEYLEFLLYTDGGEGFIGKSYVMFWSAHELLEFNRDYKVDEYAPGLFLIGSSGGGEAYALDLRTEPPTFVSVPFVGMGLDHVRKVGGTFLDFLVGLASK